MIIALLVVLILGVFGGAAVLVVQRLQTTTSFMQGGAALPEGRALEATADEDQDGLTNGNEEMWGTNPRNSDSDGDGLKDGDEVQSGHNPTIAGPNDQLPAGFAPGENVQPVPTLGFSLEQFLDRGSSTGAATSDIASFFQEGLDLSGPKQNLTVIYKAQANQPGGKSLVDFVKAQPLVTALPMVRVEEVKVADDASPASDIRSYVLSVQYVEPIVISTAFRSDLEHLVADNNPSRMVDYVDRLQKEEMTLRSALVPAQAVQLQRVLISYTQSMVASLRVIARWQEDRVAALTAIRQLDVLDRRYSPIIQQEMQRLKVLPAVSL